MNQDVMREAVRDRYGRIAKDEDGSCCGPSCGGGGEQESLSLSTGLGYDREAVDDIPEGADLGLGSGNPLAEAGLQAGDTVLDLHFSIESRRIAR